jgi:hypothetical protein
MFFGTSQTYRHFNDKLIKKAIPNKLKISITVILFAMTNILKIITT